MQAWSVAENHDYHLRLAQKVAVFSQNNPMENGDQISVALMPEMTAMIREVMEVGEYASAKEVMRWSMVCSFKKVRSCCLTMAAAQKG